MKWSLDMDMEACLTKANSWLKTYPTVLSFDLDDAILLRDPELIRGLLAVPSAKARFSNRVCNMAVNIHSVAILAEFAAHDIFPNENAYTWLFDPVTGYPTRERVAVLAWLYWCTKIRPTRAHLDNISPYLEYDEDFLDMLDEFGWEWKFSGT